MLDNIRLGIANLCKNLPISDVKPSTVSNFTQGTVQKLQLRQCFHLIPFLQGCDVIICEQSLET